MFAAQVGHHFPSPWGHSRRPPYASATFDSWLQSLGLVAFFGFRVFSGVRKEKEEEKKHLSRDAPSTPDSQGKLQFDFLNPASQGNK